MVLLPGAAAEVEQVRARRDAARDRAALAPVLRRAVADRDAARAEVTVLKERWLEIREARLDGMAAELAGQIAVGASCPVCGSVRAPALAVAAHGSPDAAGERAARKAVDDAETVVVALDDRVRHLESQHAALVALTGSEQPGSLDEELAAATDRHAERGRRGCPGRRAAGRGDRRRGRGEHACGPRSTPTSSGWPGSPPASSCTGPSATASRRASTRSWTAPASRPSPRCSDT